MVEDKRCLLERFCRMHEYLLCVFKMDTYVLYVPLYVWYRGNVKQSSNHDSIKPSETISVWVVSLWWGSDIGAEIFSVTNQSLIGKRKVLCGGGWEESGPRKKYSRIMGGKLAGSEWCRRQEWCKLRLEKQKGAGHAGFISLIKAYKGFGSFILREIE